MGQLELELGDASTIAHMQTVWKLSARLLFSPLSRKLTHNVTTAAKKFREHLAVKHFGMDAVRARIIKQQQGINGEIVTPVKNAEAGFSH